MAVAPLRLFESTSAAEAGDIFPTRDGGSDDGKIESVLFSGVNETYALDMLILGSQKRMLASGAPAKYKELVLLSDGTETVHDVLL
jgi:hypothetical protein